MVHDEVLHYHTLVYWNKQGMIGDDAESLHVIGNLNKDFSCLMSCVGIKQDAPE